jgi:pimeloyl-ACP methyl ester carboxylesterase
MELVEVDGLRITYERAGSGPPLVLLHGYVGDGPATWRYQLDGLSDAFTVVAWDAPGAGGSSDPPESFGTAGYADALAGFIAALGLETPHVAGLSFGAILALAFYRRHAVPRSLVLASAYAGWGGSLPPEVADQRLRQAYDLAGLSPDELVGTLLPTMFSQGTAPDAVEALGAAMRTFRPTGAPRDGPSLGREPPHRSPRGVQPGRPGVPPGLVTVGRFTSAGPRACPTARAPATPGPPSPP